MTGVWIALNIAASVLPGLTSKVAGLTPNQLTSALVNASAVSTVSYPLGGLLSQRIGRRPFYIGVGLLVAVVGARATPSARCSARRPATSTWAQRSPTPASRPASDARRRTR